MKRTVLITVLFAAFAGLALVGCGSDEKAVPSDAVAVVGDETITKDEFDQLINQAKGSYTQQKRPFPKPGSQEYQALRGQAMQFLVQRAQFEQKAGDFDIKVEDKDVDARLAQLKKQYFKGSEKKYAEQLKQQGLDEDAGEGRHSRPADPGEDLRRGDEGRRGLRQGDRRHLQEEQEPVRPAGDARRAAHPRQEEGSRRLALLTAAGRRRLRSARQEVLAGPQLEGSGREADDLAAARPCRRSTRPRSRWSTWRSRSRSRRSTGTTSFSRSASVKKTKTTPLKDVKEAIRQQLVQEQKQKKMTAWVDGIKKDFADEDDLPGRLLAA